MNKILGIIVLAYGWYTYKDAKEYNGINSQYYKARGYGMVFLSLILGLGLLFGSATIW